MGFEMLTLENLTSMLGHMEYAFQAYMYWIQTQVLAEVLAKVGPFLRFLGLQVDRMLNCILLSINFILSPLFRFLKPVYDKASETTRFLLKFLAVLVHLTYWTIFGMLCIPSNRLTGSEVPGVAIFTAAALYGFYTFLPTLSDYSSKLNSWASIMVPRAISCLGMCILLPFIWVAANFGTGLAWLISIPMSLYNALPSQQSILAVFPTTDSVLAIPTKVATSALHAAQMVPSVEEVKTSLTPSNLIQLLARMPSLTATAFRTTLSFASTLLFSVIQSTISGLTFTWSSLCSIAVSIYLFGLRTLSSAHALITSILEVAVASSTATFDYLRFLGHRIPMIFSQCVSWVWTIAFETALTCYTLMQGLFDFLHDTRIAIGRDHIWFSVRLSDIICFVLLVIILSIYGLCNSRGIRRSFCMILHAIVNFCVLCLGAVLVLCDKLKTQFERMIGVLDGRVDTTNVPCSPGANSNGSRCSPVTWFMPWFTRFDGYDHIRSRPQISAATDTAFAVVIRSPRAVFSEAWQWTRATLVKGTILYRQLVRLISDGVDPLHSNVLEPMRAWFNLNIYKDEFQEASHYNVYTVAHVCQMLDRLATTLLTKDSDEPWIGIDLKGKDVGVNGQDYYMVIRDYNRLDTYLIDLTRLDKQAFTTNGPDGRDLTEILECDGVLKLVFNIGPLANALACNFGIHICGVLDLQVMQAMTGPTDPDVWADFDHSIDSQTQQDPTWSEAARSTKRPVFDGNYVRFQQRPLAQDLKSYCISDVLFFLDMYTAKLPLSYGGDRSGALFNRSHLQAVKAYSDTWDPKMNAIDEDLVRTLRADESPRATILSMDSTNIPLPNSPAQPIVVEQPVSLPPSPLPVQASTEMEASVPLPDTPVPVVVVGEPALFPPTPVQMRAPVVNESAPLPPTPVQAGTAQQTPIVATVPLPNSHVPGSPADNKV